MIRMRKKLKFKINQKLREIEGNKSRMKSLSEIFSTSDFNEEVTSTYMKTMEECKTKAIVLEAELKVLEENLKYVLRYIEQDEKEQRELEQTEVIEKDGHKLTVKPTEVILEAEGLELHYYRVEGKHLLTPTTTYVDGYSLRYDEYGYVKNGRGRMKNEKVVLDKIYAGNGFVANEGFIVDLIRR